LKGCLEEKKEIGSFINMELYLFVNLVSAEKLLKKRSERNYLIKIITNDF